MDPETVEFPNLPERLSGLGELADNLWWSWNPAARMLFKMLDRQAWKAHGHNPDKMLREMPVEILASAAATTIICEIMMRCFPSFTGIYRTHRADF